MRTVSFFLLLSVISSGQVAVELSDYLVLTRDQLDAVTALKTTETEAIRGRRVRITALDAEFALEMATANPDAGRLGSLYADIERLNREGRVGILQVSVGFRSLLTPVQLVKLGLLNDAQRLNPAASAASCEGLLGPEVSDVPSSIVRWIGLGQRGLCFSSSGRSPFSSVTQVAVSGTVPQNPPIRQYLELTEAQMTAIAGTVTDSLARQREAFGLRDGVWQNLASLLSEPTLDASLLGGPLAEVARLDREIVRIDATLVRDVHAELSAAQRAKLATLGDTLRLLSPEGASCMGFFVQVPGFIPWLPAYEAVLFGSIRNFGYLSGTCWFTAEVGVGLPEPVTLPLQQRRVN